MPMVVPTSRTAPRATTNVAHGPVPTVSTPEVGGTDTRTDPKRRASDGTPPNIGRSVSSAGDNQHDNYDYIVVGAYEDSGVDCDGVLSTGTSAVCRASSVCRKSRYPRQVGISGSTLADGGHGPREERRGERRYRGLRDARRMCRAVFRRGYIDSGAVEDDDRDRVCARKRGCGQRGGVLWRGTEAQARKATEPRSAL